jgi:hypothetical protein
VASSGDGLTGGWVSSVALLPWMRWAETCAESFTTSRGTSCTSARGAVAPTGGTTLRCNIKEEKLGCANERANGLGVGAMRRRLGGVRPAWVG